jgi:hypothetical protein
MKPNAKTETKSGSKAVDTLVQVTDIVLKHRNGGAPTLAGIARVANRASLLLRISSLDERLEVENAATVALAKRHGLIS